MLQKLKLSVVRLFALSLFVAPLTVGLANAQPNIDGSLCEGANLQFGAAQDCDDSGTEDSVNNLITDVVNIISVIVGIVAVVMIIYGGFRYITSGGDSGNVTNAKNTILYAIIGLVIVALAQFIVRFVLNQTSGLV